MKRIFAVLATAALLVFLCPSTSVLASPANPVVGCDLYGAGFNLSGALGIGNLLDQSTPTQMILPGGVRVVDKVTTASSASEQFTAVITTTGDVYATGYNAQGQLGNGTTVVQSVPVQYVLPVGVTGTDLVSSPLNLYTIGSDGNVYASGDNAFGQLGDSTFVDKSTPAVFQLPAGVTAIKAVAGVKDTTAKEAWLMVLGSDGNVYGAGYNGQGQLGNGTTVNQSTPVVFQLPLGVSAVDVVTSYTEENFVPFGGTTLVLGSDGNVYGAGYNGQGQLGNGNTVNQSTPVVFQLPGGVSGSEIWIGRSTYVIASDGNVYGAGYNGQGQLGNGNTVNQSTPVVFQLPGGVSAVEVQSAPDAFGYAETSVLGSDGQVYGAGLNYVGILGNGNTLLQSTPVIFQLPLGVTAQDVILTNSDQYVLGSDGQVYGAGYNGFGALGDGTTTDRSIPVVFQLPVGISASAIYMEDPIYAKENNNPNALWVLGSDNQIYTAGDNFRGELGDGTTISHSVPAVFQLPLGVTADGGSLSSSPGSVEQSTYFHALTDCEYAVGNIVYIDVNDNGIQDSGEVGLDGVTVRLYADANTDGIPDGAALSSQNTVTVAGQPGRYLFDALPRGSYLVEMDIPTGYLSSTDIGTSLTPNNDTDIDDNGITFSTTVVRSGTVTLNQFAEPDYLVDTDHTLINSTVDFGIFLDPLAPPPPGGGGTGGGSSSSGPDVLGVATCDAEPPSGSPDFFQLDRSGDGGSATLHFSPAGDPVDSYIIWYGTSSDANEYSMIYTPSSPVGGAYTVSVHGLNPSNTYYFKVQAKNMCKTGAYSTTRSTKRSLANTGTPIALSLVFGSALLLATVNIRRRRENI